MYSCTAARSGTTLIRSLTGRPQPRIRSYQPDWVSGGVTPSGKPSTRPTPWTITSSARLAVTRGSFCRSEPAAELRALANAALPASVSRAFSSSNAVSGRNTSPRTSRISGKPDPVSRAGIESIVRMFGVTSSPVRPSPRVAPRVRMPFR
jgi:hypothetical protein